MAIKGELKGVDGTGCICGKTLDLQVCMSAAGYYLGYWCNMCGPYSRESGYFRTHEEAEAALNHEADMMLRDTEYHG